LPVEDAVRSLEEPVFVQHGHQSPDCEIADRRSFRLPSSRGIRAELRGFSLASKALLANPLANGPFWDFSLLCDLVSNL
jgi:hypothetical protein